MNDITDYLNYNETTGEFTWIKPTTRSIKVGQIAGTLHHDGYIQIKFKGKYYGAHRLAWYFVRGEWPEFEIDHEDGNRSNNRPNNLRVATKTQNAWNTKLRADNKSGYKGVGNHQGLWRARIVVNGKELHLGTFEHAIDAHRAYKEAAKKYFGEFANDGSVC